MRPNQKTRRRRASRMPSLRCMLAAAALAPLLVAISNGDRPLFPGLELPAGDRPLSVSTGDFYGDGLTDLATPDSFSANVSVLLNQCATEIALGDANGDGKLSNLDIVSFVLALTIPKTYQAMFPDADPDFVLDMNFDGVFNNLDIAGFVAALTGRPLPFNCDDHPNHARCMGTPLGISFDVDGFVDEVFVEVRDEWLESNNWALQIEITGLNGGPAFHGTDLINVNETTVFATDGTIAATVVAWTEDKTSQSVNELYTVCVQVLWQGCPVGEEKCEDFGPF